MLVKKLILPWCTLSFSVINLMILVSKSSMYTLSLLEFRFNYGIQIQSFHTKFFQKNHQIL